MKKTTLGNLCKPAAGQVKIGQNELVDYFDISSVDNERKCITGYDTYRFADAPSRARKAVSKNSIMVSTVRPNLNAVAIFNEDTENTPVVSTGFCVLDCNDEVNPRFVFNFCRSKAFVDEMVSQATGASYPAVSDKIVRSAIVPCYSRNEQDKICKALDGVSSIIESRKQELQKLDELVKARFVEMFGDCLTNPKGWKTKCLEDISEVGSSKRVFVEELQDSGIPFYRGTEVGALAEGKSVIPELFITEEHYNILCAATGKPQLGDLLMPSICPDGRIWVVDSENPFYFKDGRVLWVHNIAPSYNPVFLLYTLKDRIMTDYSSIASGTTFAELKIFALKKCQVFDVPLELQNQFAAFIKQVDKSKVAVQEALDEAQLLFDSLMQKYFG